MYGTIIRDVYSEADTQKVADALEELCSPKDRMGWASNGVYCFWNVDTGEVLYVGLARDLPTRFRQHNGLLKCREDGCKVREIRAHFSQQDRLGYSVLVQSPLAQLPVSRAADDLVRPRRHDDYDEYMELVEHGETNIVRVEGALIESHNRARGALPTWNKIHGSWIGRARVRDDTIGLLWVMTAGDGPLVARRSIRDLDEDGEAFMLEETLHGARSQWLLDEGLDWEVAIAMTARWSSPTGQHEEKVRVLREYAAKEAPQF